MIMMTLRPLAPAAAAASAPPRFFLLLRAALVVACARAFAAPRLSAPSGTAPAPPSSSALFAEAAKSTSPSTRRPWNVFRFVRQSSRFVSVLPQKKAATKAIVPGSVVWEPSAAGTAAAADFTFAPLDDVVMGGASASAFSSSGGRWTGQVTDANNGGFVGIRSTPPFEYDLGSCRGLELTVRTASKSKRRYKLGLRDSKEFNGIVWAATFLVGGSRGGGSSAAATTTVRVPFSQLVPTLFARTVPGAPAFNRKAVVGIQLVYSKFEYDGKLNDTFEVGDVDLELVSIKAY